MSAHGAALGYRAAGPSGWCGGAQRGGREREHNEERATMGVWCNEPIMRMGTPAVWQSRRCSEGGNMLSQRHFCNSHPDSPLALLVAFDPREKWRVVAIVWLVTVQGLIRSRRLWSFGL